MDQNNPITGLVRGSRERITNWNSNPGYQRWPLIIAHRGDTSAAPENTMPAFYRAIQSGADGIELGVRLTRDNELVVFHDYTLGRTSDGYGLVNHYTLKELQSLDVGSWFSARFKGESPPSLDQVFESLPGDHLLNVEMKVVIKDMHRIAQRVADTGRPITMEPMPPNERRIVHLALADHPRVTTESQGEGSGRQVVVQTR